MTPRTTAATHRTGRLTSALRVLLLVLHVTLGVALPLAHAEAGSLDRARPHVEAHDATGCPTVHDLDACRTCQTLHQAAEPATDDALECPLALAAPAPACLAQHGPAPDGAATLPRAPPSC